MHVAVIGHGLIGAATARHLAEAGHRVTLIGPGEPADKTTHQGPFASHYDEGRIARVLDHSTLWTRIKGASMARFRAIEAASGIGFFEATGGMMAGPADGPLLTRADQVRRVRQVPALHLDAAALAGRFPFFAFGAGFAGLYEPDAGWINPRRLIAAQTRLASAAGAMVIPEVVQALEETASGVEVTTGGRRIRADHAVLATGAFVRDLTARALPVEIYARTVLFLEVDTAEAARLAGMPTLVMEARNGREPYLLPPIRYPDGGLWIKIGGDPVDLPLEPAAMGDWFRGPGKPEVAGYLREVLDRLMPGLRVLRTRTEACAVTFTREDRPLVDRLSPHVTIATAGCARGAKGSDEIGRLAAEEIAGRGWPELALLARTAPQRMGRTAR
jgi:sarcosine oxidase